MDAEQPRLSNAPPAVEAAPAATEGAPPLPLAEGNGNGEGLLMGSMAQLAVLSNRLKQSLMPSSRQPAPHAEGGASDDVLPTVSENEAAPPPEEGGFETMEDGLAVTGQEQGRVRGVEGGEEMARARAALEA